MYDVKYHDKTFIELKIILEVFYLFTFTTREPVKEYLISVIK